MTTAVRDVSSNPSGKAVTQPTDAALKSKDIDRKMRLYGVVEAFRQGNYPSNQQIEETLNYVEEHSPVRTQKLSKEGRKLINDVRKIISTARKLILEKNEDELFQNFLYHSRHVDTHKLNPANNVKTPLGKDQVKQQGDNAAEHLRTLAKLIFTNGEFRKIMQDLSYIGRDIAADAAQKAANAARPDEEKLNQVDETAPSNRWHGPDGQVRGPNESAPDTGLGAKRDQLASAKEQAKGLKEEVKGHTQDAAQRAGDSADNERPGQKSSSAVDAVKGKADEVIPDEHKEQARAHADDAKKRVDAAVANASGPNQSVPPDGDLRKLTEAEQQAAKEAGKSTAKDKAKSVIPQEHRDKASAKVDEAKDYLSDKVSKERRERFYYRLKKVVVEQQRHRDYQEAIDYFLGLFETYQGHAQDIHNQTQDHAQSNVRGDPAYAKAEMELRTLVERFANDTSCQPIVEAINVIYTDAQNDPELKKWFRQADKYVRRVLQEPGFIMKEQCDKEGRRLKDSGGGLFGDRYRPHREALVNEIQDFFQAFADDPLNKQFGEDIKALTKDLFLDGDGDFKYKSHLWKDIRTVIAPDLFKQIGYVPIPRIEYLDDNFEVVIENLTLESQNILPNIFEIEARTYHKLSPYDNIENRSRQSIFVQFSQIQADLKEVAFYFKRKSGFPRLSDRGLADVFLGGQGLSGKVHLETSRKKSRLFDIKEVHVKVDTLDFKIRKSKHNVLYAIMRPLVTGLLKKQISKAVQDAIRSGLDALDVQLVEIRDRLDEAADDDETSRLDVLKNVFNEKKKDAEKVKDSTGTFQFVAKRDSKLIEYESKNSMVGKQAEREKKAGKGTGWKSPAFDIVPGSHTDTKTRSKGIDGASNVPTRDFKRKNPDGAGVIDKPATEAGAAVAGVGAGAGAAKSASKPEGDKSPSIGSAVNAAAKPGALSSPPREIARGAVGGAAMKSGPLAASAAPGAGKSPVSPPNASPKSKTINNGTSLPPPVAGSNY